jgi:hypothetical protein
VGTILESVGFMVTARNLRPLGRDLGNQTWARTRFDNIFGPARNYAALTLHCAGSGPSGASAATPCDNAAGPPSGRGRLCGPRGHSHLFVTPVLQLIRGQLKPGVGPERRRRRVKVAV